MTAGTADMVPDRCLTPGRGRHHSSSIKDQRQALLGLLLRATVLLRPVLRRSGLLLRTAHAAST
eukprot:4365529-Alexandrium_andersonii.AAC.1